MTVGWQRAETRVVDVQGLYHQPLAMLQCEFTTLKRDDVEMLAGHFVYRTHGLVVAKTALHAVNVPIALARRICC